ncbi:hypothetical protein ABK046_36835 [Streptomyces caeruleatus]
MKELIDSICFGPHRVPRKIRQDFNLATFVLAGACAAGRARLTVHRISDSSPLGGHLEGAVAPRW